MESTKKDAILSACLEEFAAYGYQNASTNRICEKAGVAKGLIFHHFGSKKALFILTVRSCMADALIHLEGFVPSGDFVASTASYAAYKAAFFVDHPFHCRVLQEVVADAPREVLEDILPLLKSFSEAGNRILDVLLAKIPLRSGVSHEQAKSLVSAVLGSVETKYRVHLKQGNGFNTVVVQSLQDEYRELMQLVLRGISEN